MRISIFSTILIVDCPQDTVAYVLTSSCLLRLAVLRLAEQAHLSLVQSDAQTVQGTEWL